MIDEKIIKPGYSLSLFLNEFVKVIITKDIEENTLSKYLHKLADVENAVSISTFGNIYTLSIIGIFKEE